MKKAIVLFSCLLSTAIAVAQSSPKKYCKNGKECQNAILQLLPEYSFKKDTVLEQSNIVMYSDANGEKLQFVYDIYFKESERYYQFKSIVGPFSTMQKIYSQFYGREIEPALLQQNGDRWKFSTGSLELNKVDGWPGYWMIRIF